jgi:dTDP-4-dehydrorhamnose 3,5-epimerase
MKAIETTLKDAYVIITNRFGDERGFFLESYNHEKFGGILGVDNNFVQDNHSKSSKGVLRGLHYQKEHPQGKLVRCTQGSVYDVIVDLRTSSPTFGKSFGIELDDNSTMLWVPVGFAHAFYTLSDYAEFQYKCTDYYHPESQETLMWNDPDLDIEWPFTGNPVLSLKDQQGKSFKECFKYEYE